MSERTIVSHMVLGVSLGGHAAWYVPLVASPFQMHGLALKTHFTSRVELPRLIQQSHMTNSI